MKRRPKRLTTGRLLGRSGGLLLTRQQFVELALDRADASFDPVDVAAQWDAQSLQETVDLLTCFLLESIKRLLTA